MAYDREKAHEYYIKYRKKGLKKGRKKGRAKAKTTIRRKKAAKASLLGFSTAGLNGAGLIQAGLLKERLSNEMNAKLAQARTPEERDLIRAQYSQMAQDQLGQLKNDSNYAKPKNTSTKRSESPKRSAEKTSSPKKESQPKQKTETLVGVSTAGLNDSGKMKAAMLKKNLQDEMNAALAEASTAEEKDRIKQDYQERALKEIGNLKNDSNYATPKKEKTTSLVGLSSSGLNDAGKMQAELLKESLQKEMNQKMSEAPTEEAKDKIRQEYQNKAYEQIQSMKADPMYQSESAKKKTESAQPEQDAQEQISYISDRIAVMKPEERAAAKIKIETALAEIEAIVESTRITKDKAK